MQLREALDKANQILDEERSSPTVRYTPAHRVSTESEPTPQMTTSFERLMESFTLSQLRAERPRQVLEDSRRFVFRSLNYDLLSALLSQLPQEERSSFVHSVLLRIILEGALGPAKTTVYLSWNGFVSELPLVLEFAVRNGGKEHFFRILAEAKARPEHVVLLKDLEEMIVLNYTLFSDAEYERLAFAVQNFRTITRNAIGDRRKALASQVTLAHEIDTATDAIIEECRKARYLFLKGSLLEGLNLEVNQDKDAVESYLAQMGFSKTLIECLSKADNLYRGPADAFDLKSSMGHLRSFLESLQNEAVSALAAKLGDTPSVAWGPGLAYLRNKGLLSETEEKFAAALYRLISDEAVHPLIAEKEYARLARNMVIEYGLLFLRKLEKSGIGQATTAKS